MVRSSKLYVASAAAIVTAIAACGGSSSETPWPAEPENTLGPISEAAAASGVPNEPEPPDADAGPTDNGPVKKQPASQQTQHHRRRGPSGPGSTPF